MKLESIKKILSVLPEGERKNQLMKRIQAFQEKRGRNSEGAGGLEDEFKFQAEGHISIEEINADGEVIGVLADQPNLVVDGAEEILLRAFSGDPSRVLYKNRTLKDSEEKTYHIYLDELINIEGNQNVIAANPNVIWGAIDEDDFDYEYSYYPNTLHIKEVQSTIPGMKAFTITEDSSASTAPLTAEIYSTFTNMFIGIGDGKNYKVSLDNSKLTWGEGFTGDVSKKETSTVNSEFSFKEKISNFVLGYETHAAGGNIEVLVDNRTIKTINTKGAEGVEEFEFKIENPEVESEVKIRFSGADEGVEDPKIIIESLKWDAFSKDMTQLIHELEDFTTEFRTPTAYNTRTIAPFTIQLDHAPLVPGTLVVSYNEEELTEVEDKDNIGDMEYYVDELTGLVEFNKALTDLIITFDVTGEITENRNTADLDNKVIEYVVASEKPNGDQDGINREFYLKKDNVHSVSVYLNDNQLVSGSNFDYSMTNSTGRLVLTNPPASSDNLRVNYKFDRNVNVLKTDYLIDTDKEVVIYDQAGRKLEKVSNVSETSVAGTYALEEEDNDVFVMINQETASQESLVSIKALYYSKEKPGVETKYKRQVVLKPKDVNQYPWYSLDKGSVQFVAEFDEGVPLHNVTIREMGLFDGPRVDDKIKGYTGYAVKPFSLVRVGESIKDSTTGLRITWTITLLNEEGNPFESQ